MTKTCKHCGKQFETKPNGATRQYCFECSPAGEALQGNILRKRIKLWALEYKGCVCEKCDYNKSISALEFHHLDPSQKDFNLSSQNISSDWETIKKELDKCILVCANCHREIHEEETLKKKIILEEKQVANAKRVRCINTNEVFGSCEIAGFYFHINNPANIKDVCNGTRNYCGKHPETEEKLEWEWADLTEEELKIYREKKQQFLIKTQKNEEKRIEQVRKANQIKIKSSTGEIFDSIVLASKWCKIAPQNIGRALKNPKFTSGCHPETGERLHWFYVKGDDIIETPT